MDEVQLRFKTSSSLVLMTVEALRLKAENVFADLIAGASQICIVFPDGNRIESAEQIIGMHRSFFSSESTSFLPSEEGDRPFLMKDFSMCIEKEHLAFYCIDVFVAKKSFSESDDCGQHISIQKIYLSFLLACESAATGWRIRHIQNTVH